MNIATYIQQSRSVAMYHEKSPLANFTYPTLGLAGEIGEMIDKITSLLPREMGSKEEVTKELGDILWYTINILPDAGLSFLDIVGTLTSGVRVDNFTELCTIMKPSQDKRPATLKLPIYAGHMSEIAKKMIRDSDGGLPCEKLPTIEKSICEVIRCLDEVCETWDINMDDVAQMNIDKLFSRRDRGVLSGEGDNR